MSRCRHDVEGYVDFEITVTSAFKRYCTPRTPIIWKRCPLYLLWHSFELFCILVPTALKVYYEVVLEGGGLIPPWTMLKFNAQCCRMYSARFRVTSEGGSGDVQ